MQKSKMTIVEHLREFKNRVIYCLLFFTSSFAVCYYFIEKIYLFIAKPLIINGATQMIYTSIGETFFTYLHLASMCAIGISTPFWLTQGYLFLSPALYKKEKFTVLTFFTAFTILFLAGIAVLYYGILPNAVNFLLHYQSSSTVQITFYAKISEYVGAIISMAIGFGFAFQLPLVLIALSLFGIINYKQIKQFRRYAIVIIFTLSAILTPPDVLSQIILASIMIIFYEITIIICRMLYKEEPPFFNNLDSIQ